MRYTKRKGLASQASVKLAVAEPVHTRIHLDMDMQYKPLKCLLRATAII